jgi:type I restriction enzyme M protein
MRTTAEEEIDLTATHATLTDLDKIIREATQRHNDFLKELDLPLLPYGEPKQK